MTIEGIHPQSEPRNTTSDAELRVYRALARPGGLPEGAAVWHSFAFSYKGNDHEIDFLYAHPELGMLAIEVKGGQITLVDGHYRQNGRPAGSPAAQARSAIYALAAYLSEKWGHSPPFTHALWFPDMAGTGGIKVAELEGRVLDNHALTYSREALEELSQRLFTELDRRPPRSTRSRFIQGLNELWGAAMSEREIPLGSRFLKHQRERARLDESQRSTLDSLIENERCIIKGAAGTGKTQLARFAALARAEEGQRVLYTCFTEGLAQELSRSFLSPNIEVTTVRALALRYALEAGKIESEPKDAAEWDALMPLGTEALLDAGAPWDVIIIDEAQDFSEADWFFIEAASDGEKPLWAFLDDAQRFWSDRALPGWLTRRAMRYTLGEQYRVPSALFALAEAVSLPQGAEREDAIKRASEVAELEGQFQLIIRENTQRALQDALHRAIHNEQIAPEHISVLSLRGSGAHNTIASAESIGTFNVARVSDEDAHQKIVADTFLRFKGLERPLVFIMDLEDVKDSARTRLHIAVTRAFNRAVLITTREAAEAHGLA